MIESKRELLATKPEEQIACWGEQLEKANIKRSRYQAQEAESLMTRQELRPKLAELDETVDLAEAAIEKLRHHEKSIKAMARSYSNATPSSYPNSWKTSPRPKGDTPTKCSRSVSRCPSRVAAVLGCPSLLTRERLVVEETASYHCL